MLGEGVKADTRQIPFVFGNTEQTITPLGDSKNVELSKLVMSMWASFAYNLDPNGHGGTYINCRELV
jgi:carboxylesterase type B